MTPGNYTQEFSSLPNLPRHLHQPVKFPPHGVFARRFGIDAAEAALGADRELFDRDVTRGLIDAAFEVVSGFYVRTLRGHESQDDDFVLGDEAQWLEATGALAVVLQQNTIVLEAAEELFGDGIVVGLRGATAARACRFSRRWYGRCRGRCEYRRSRRKSLG